MANQFKLDVAKIRKQARQHMGTGAVVTETYKADLDKVIAVLNDVVATEIVCWLRYQRHASAAQGINRRSVAAEFTEHANDEMGHALLAADRITQLGGDVNYSPDGLAQRAHTEYVVCSDDDLDGMLKENLVAERTVIQTYQEIIRWIGDGDPTTRRMLEGILQDEEEHADDLLDLLGTVVSGDK